MRLPQTQAFLELLERLRDYTAEHHRDHWCAPSAMLQPGHAVAPSATQRPAQSPTCIVQGAVL